MKYAWEAFVAGWTGIWNWLAGPWRAQREWRRAIGRCDEWDSQTPTSQMDEDLAVARRAMYAANRLLPVAFAEVALATIILLSVVL